MTDIIKPGLSDIKEAHKRIEQFIHRTPVLSSGQFVSLVDFDKPDGRSEYLPGFVGTIKFPPELNPRGTSGTPLK